MKAIKPWVFALSFITALGVALWFFSSQRPASRDIAAPINQKDKIVDGASALPGTPSPAEPAKAKTRNAAIQLWTLVDATAQEAPPKLRDDLPGELVRLDRETLARLVPGDTLTLPLNDAIAQTATISSVRDHAKYSVVSFKGTTTGEIALPVVITLGDEAVFATISTTSGVFELRGREDLAWIYRASDLTPPGSEDEIDYVIPQDEEPQ